MFRALKHKLESSTKAPNFENVEGGHALDEQDGGTDAYLLNSLVGKCVLGVAGLAHVLVEKKNLFRAQRALYEDRDTGYRVMSRPGQWPWFVIGQVVNITESC